MWMVIHMARSLSVAQTIRELLTREGFLVKMTPVYRALGSEENLYEMMVPELEAAEARQVLLDHGIC